MLLSEASGKEVSKASADRIAMSNGSAFGQNLLAPERVLASQAASFLTFGPSMIGLDKSPPVNDCQSTIGPSRAQAKVSLLFPKVLSQSGAYDSWTKFGLLGMQIT